jgi:hypothetical protein
MTISKQEVHGGLNTIRAVADAIKEANEIPSGHLYAAVMQWVDLCGYEKIISILTRAGLVEETPGHLLKWKGNL